MKYLGTTVNRYDAEYSFFELNDGNVLMKGPFDMHRCSYKNVYDDSYIQYVTDIKLSDAIFEPLSFDQFVIAVHKTKHYTKYSELVDFDRSFITMIDPSGGPYLCEGMQIYNKTIIRFEPHKEGYKILVK